eukprot:72656_1
MINNINEAIIEIKCGYTHSLIKTKELKYYTFGFNYYNEVTLYNNDKDIISLPYYINDVVEKGRNDIEINNVYLGVNCTYICIGYVVECIEEKENKKYLYSINDEKTEEEYEYENVIRNALIISIAFDSFENENNNNEIKNILMNKFDYIFKSNRNKMSKNELEIF